MRRSRGIVFVIIIGWAATVTFAESDGVFQKYDRNGDGRVTTAELPNPQTLARFDQDRDGNITEAEYHRSAGVAPPPPLRHPRPPGRAVRRGPGPGAVLRRLRRTLR